MDDLKEILHHDARPMPVIILADISGSMEAYGKIEALNTSIREMITSLSAEVQDRVLLQLAVITFGGTATLHTQLQPVSMVSWNDLRANGGTPMGAALRLATELIEDKDKIPSRAFRPTIVLVSDGLPTDDWEHGFRNLTESGRAAKAERLAIGIGPDADPIMLGKFINHPDAKLFQAADASQIVQFFRFVTFSVSQRSRSSNPNQSIASNNSAFKFDDF